MSRSRHSTGRVTLYAVCSILFGFGAYFGYRLSQPPAKPDFSSPLSDRPASEPASSIVVPTPVDELARESSEAPGTGDAQSDAAPSAEVTGTNGGVVPGTPQTGVPGTAGARRAAGGQFRVAIVFDDLGRDVEQVEALARLGIPLTYSVLPFEPKTAEVTAELRRRGLEFLCHIPMEALGGANPGPGALLKSMSTSQVRQATISALDAVEGAVGVNNHMGSALASDRQALITVLRQLKERGLFFVDSRTTAETVAFTIARQLDIPAAERQVFLDVERDQAAIAEQFGRLLAVARTRGSALAIAHPHPETLAAIEGAIPGAREQGFTFVTASELLER